MKLLKEYFYSLTIQMSTQVGRVKWFNKQKGFGFLTVASESGDVDTFVHHSSIKVGDSSFRYLVPGEYVSFGSKSMDDGKVCAADVTGVNGGKLMCETQREYVPKNGTNETPSTDDGEWTSVSRRPSSNRGRGRGRGRGSFRGRGRGKEARPSADS